MNSLLIALKAFCLPLCLAMGSTFGALWLSAPAAGPVAAVFPPWWGAARAMQAAATAGRIAGFGNAPFVIVVVPEGSSAAARLRGAGAWLLLHPRTVGGCVGGPVNEENI